MTGGVVIGAAIGVGQPGATCVHQEVTMTATTQLRIVVPIEARPSRAPVIPDGQVINLTIERDEKLLLSVVEAAHRLGVGRTLMYMSCSAPGRSSPCTSAGSTSSRPGRSTTSSSDGAF